MSVKNFFSYTPLAYSWYLVPMSFSRRKNIQPDRSAFGRWTSKFDLPPYTSYMKVLALQNNLKQKLRCLNVPVKDFSHKIVIKQVQIIYRLSSSAVISGLSSILPCFFSVPRFFVMINPRFHINIMSPATQLL